MKNILIALLLISVNVPLHAQIKPTVLLLWEDGAPGSENRKDEPEKAKDWWVKNIHNPSIEIYSPAKPNGTAILICPGGGHKALVFEEEGTKAAKFLNKFGITAAVLKYRLFREEGSTYNIDHPTQDLTRAMMLLRSNAEKWGIDRNRVGIMAFSAGGELANLVTFNKKKTALENKESDPAAQLATLPNFLIQIYPGPIGTPEAVSKKAPPLFLLASNNDKCCSETIFQLLKVYRDAEAPVEAHFYTKGDHGFNMGDRSPYESIKGWPQRLADWLLDNNYFSTTIKD